MVDHYKSCQVYVPDYKIESVTVTGSGEIKVTLEGRLRANNGAPSSVTNSSAGWDSYLASETGPRSDENALVEYLRWFAGSGTNCLQRIGDWAPDASASYTSTIKGSCMPRFYFTRQIPKVYEDVPPNQILETHDTRMVTDEIIWMDLVLRAICEGYIDETSTQSNREYINGMTGFTECYEKRLFDYTYENLLLQSNLNRWQRVIPLSERSDNPKMFGPFPDVITYAEHFNQISNAVNKLHRARLYLPLEIQYRNIKYKGTGYFGAQGDGNCYNGAVWGEDLTAPEASTLVSTGSWFGATPGGDTIIAYQRADIRDDGAGNCIIYNDRQDVEYKIVFTDLSENSLPPELYALVVDNQGTGFMGTFDLIVNKKERVLTTVGNGWTGNSSDEADYYDDQGNPQDWVDPAGTGPTILNTTCEIAHSGTLKAPLPDVSDYVDTNDGGFGEGSEKQKNLTWFSVQAYVDVPLV